MAWRSADYGYYQRLMAAAAQIYAKSLQSIARYAETFMCSAMSRFTQLTETYTCYSHLAWDCSVSRSDPCNRIHQCCNHCAWILHIIKFGQLAPFLHLKVADVWYMLRHSYSSGVHVASCEDQYAKALQGANVVPVCISAAAQLNGSAVALYNSSSIYDKLLWAATWMYRATGDTDYLGDAESFYLSHIYNEGGTQVCTALAPASLAPFPQLAKRSSLDILAEQHERSCMAYKRAAQQRT